MPSWPSVRRDNSIVGDGLHVSQNSRYRYDGELRQRVGLIPSTVPKASTAVTRLIPASDYLYVCDGIDIITCTIASIEEGTPGSVYATRSYASAYPTPIVFDKVVYLYGGPSLTKVTVSSGVLKSIGLNAPSALSALTSTGTGSIDIGLRLYRGRRESTRGHLNIMSNPSVINDIDVTVAGRLLHGSDYFDNGNADVIEMTLADGATFYRTVEADWTDGGTTITYAEPDTILQQNTPSSFYGDYGHDAPYDATIACFVRGRVFIGGYSSAVNRQYWSQAGFPESFYLTQQFYDTFDDGDVQTACIEYLGDQWVFGLSSALRYIWGTDPADGEELHLPGSLGVWNQRCLVKADRTLYGWGPNGLWYIEGGRQVHISRPIDDIFQADFNENHTARFHICYDPDERELLAFYVPSSVEWPTNAFVLDVDTGAWHTATYDFGISASALSMTADRPRLLLGDSSGYTWIRGGTTDGQETGYSSLQEVGFGTTSTSIRVDSAGECIGAMMYYPGTDEVRRIQSFGSGVAVVSPAFSSTPLEGEEVAIGGIDFAVETKWWVDESLITKKMPVTFNVEFVPQDEGTLRVEIYRDFSDTLIEFTDLDSDTLPDGIELADGVFYIDLSKSDGFVRVPLETNRARALKARLVSNRLAPTPQLLRMYFQPTPHGSIKGDKE